MITKEIFYNKELCDSIRDVTVNSPCNIKEAIILLSASNNYNRDSELIIKMYCVGLKYKKVLLFISAINY